VRKQNGEQNASLRNDQQGAGIEQNAEQNARAPPALAIFAPKSPAPYRDKKNIL
jgi:hypothetical protein